MQLLIKWRFITPKRVFYPVQLVLFLALFVFLGCRSEPSSPVSVFFPKYNLVNGEWVRMSGEIEGELVKTGNCLRLIASPSNTNYLVVWPPGYELDEEGSDILIRDNGGQVVAWVGEKVYMGGGEVYAREDEIATLEGVPGVSKELITEIENSGCPGPYWISGGVILGQDE